MIEPTREIVIRSLNETRRTHLPSYCALRSLVQSESARSEQWVSSFVNRKVYSREAGRYLLCDIFKHLDDGTPKYRQMFFPSPTTSLIEASLLVVLAQIPHFKPHPRVYSYLWPGTDRAGQIYRYYRPGYVLRNQDITTLLKNRADHVLLIADIQDFYPSVDRDRVADALRSELALIDVGSAHKTAINQALQAVLNGTAGLQGLPVGPPLSHFLANFVLRRVDEVMSRDYGEAYHRYVDDIILVLPRSDAETAKAKLALLLKEEGLQLHPQKTEVIDSDEWLAGGPQILAVSSGSGFKSFIDELTLFLARCPEQDRQLATALGDAGIGIPLGRLRQVAAYSRFRHFLLGIGRRFGLTQFGLSKRFSDVGEVVARAKLLRTEFLTAFDLFLGKKPPSKTNGRKWHFQRGRYILNRLIYLGPRSSFDELLSKIRHIPEFYDVTAILSAFVSGNADPVLSLPGAPIRVYAELMNHYGLLPKVRFRDDGVPSRFAIESLAVLALYHQFSPSESWLAQLPPAARAYLSFCLPGRECDGPRDLSYLDEVLSLKISSRASSLEQLSTRFDDAEEVSLEALNLGGDYYA